MGYARGQKSKAPRQARVSKAAAFSDTGYESEDKDYDADVSQGEKSDTEDEDKTINQQALSAHFKTLQPFFGKKRRLKNPSESPADQSVKLAKIELK